MIGPPGRSLEHIGAIALLQVVHPGAVALTSGRQAADTSGVTLVADPTAPPQRSQARGHGLALHVAALALVLLALVPLVGTGASFSADEGAAIVQARSLSRGDGWIVEHPVPQADPTGVNYPLENSERGPRGVAPYAKHPLYPVLLAAVDRLGGVTGMVLLSLAGTLAAAAMAALLARRLDPALDRPVLWVVGLGSPLLFDGFLVIGHALGAALAVAAVLLAVRAVERRRPLDVLAIGPVVAAGVMLRTEFVFVALALAATVFVAGLAARRLAVPALVAAVSVTAAVAARAGDREWTGRILGPAGAGVPLPPGTLAGGGVAGRFRGFVLTWLTPGYGDGGTVHLALVVMLVSVAVAAWLARRRPEEARLITGASVTAVGAAVVALVAAPANGVPGLLVAFPLAAAGLLLVRRDHVTATAGRLALGTFGLFALGVVATQYQRGGSGEWGGRYFAVGIAVVTPVLVLAVRDAGRRLAPQVRRIAGVALAGCMVALSVMGAGSLRAAHQRNGSMNDAVAAAAAATPAGDGGPAVVVAADGTLARHGWPTFDQARWLLASAGVPALAERLRAAGIPQFVHVTRDPAGPGGGLTVVDRRAGGDAGRPWYVMVVRAG